MSVSPPWQKPWNDGQEIAYFNTEISAKRHNGSQIGSFSVWNKLTQLEGSMRRVLDPRNVLDERKFVRECPRRVLWMAYYYYLRQHLCISYASVVGILAYWFCICCFHLQAYVIMPDERRNIDLELKVGLWICLSSYGMTSMSSFKIKCSKFFQCLPNKESFILLIMKNNLHTSEMYIYIYMDH